MHVLAAGLNSGVYKLVLVLHIMCAIVGFGAVYLNGLYAAQVRAHRVVRASPSPRRTTPCRASRSTSSTPFRSSA